MLHTHTLNTIHARPLPSDKWAHLSSAHIEPHTSAVSFRFVCLHVIGLRVG
jgi:hypothetical protein